jgi:hypothetical protein
VVEEVLGGAGVLVVGYGDDEVIVEGGVGGFTTGEVGIEGGV